LLASVLSISLSGKKYAEQNCNSSNNLQGEWKTRADLNNGNITYRMN